MIFGVDGSGANLGLRHWLLKCRGNRAIRRQITDSQFEQLFAASSSDWTASVACPIKLTTRLIVALADTGDISRLSSRGRQVCVVLNTQRGVLEILTASLAAACLLTRLNLNA